MTQSENDIVKVHYYLSRILIKFEFVFDFRCRTQRALGTLVLLFLTFFVFLSPGGGFNFILAMFIATQRFSKAEVPRVFAAFGTKGGFAPGACLALLCDSLPADLYLLSAR